MQKTLFCFMLLLMGRLSSSAQVTFEHSYDTSGYPGYILFPKTSLLVSLTAAGEKYAFVNNSVINLYNLNHSLYKSIALPAPAPYISSGIPNYGTVLNISDQLFDLDDSIEVMIEYSVSLSGGTAATFIRVYKESGTLLFERDSSDFEVFGQFMNTTAGTKLLLLDKVYQPVNNDVGFSIFGLPGTYVAGLKEPVSPDYGNLSAPYPNPSRAKAEIKYDLPSGVNQGEVIFYTMQGEEIKRYKVDRTFNSLLLDNSDLKSGTYLYCLTTSKGSVGARKMIVMG